MATAASFLSSPYLEHTVGGAPVTTRGAGIHIGMHPREPKVIYGSGKNVVVRNLENPTDTFVYRGHNANVTAAKFSTSGYWVASGDATGRVRVWSWDNPEHILKLETIVFSGEVKDLAWDKESKRIVAVGDASGQTLAKCFVWDTGSAVGQLVGHSKRVLTCDYRPERPFRIATGAEDMLVKFYNGPPFQLDHTNSGHSNFVNSVRFSPDGSRLVSVGTDKKVIMYDGRSGEPTGELATGHAGSIYDVAWSPEGTHILTCSSDKTCRVTDATSGEVEVTFALSPDPQVSDFQVAVAWAGPHMISVSLDGSINFLDRGSPGAPVNQLVGHQAAIVALHHDAVSGCTFTGSNDGTVIQWRGPGDAVRIAGTDKRHVAKAAHGGKVAGVTTVGGQLMTVGWDDAARLALVGESAMSASLPLGGQPVGVACAPAGALAAVATNNGVQLISGGAIVGELSGLAYTPTSVAVWGAEEVAVGGSDSKIHIYAVDGATLTETAAVEGHRGQVTALAYSPAGDMLAAGDSNREVNVWVRGSWEGRVRGLWQNHTTRITAVAWAPSGDRLVSSSLDENLIVWSVSAPRTKIQLPFAHKDGATGVAFIDEDHLVSCGMDSVLAWWNLAAVPEHK